MLQSELPLYLKRINIITGKKYRLSDTAITKNDVSSYYRATARFYKKLHSAEGAIHFPVRDENVSHSEGLLYQAKEIDKTIKSGKFNRVLELGCGKGFNLFYLATHNPDVQFEGMDITDDNIIQAKEKVKETGIANLSFYEGDYESLTQRQDKYDLIFAVESLCHSENINQTLKGIYQSLNPSGRLIIFDGYKTSKLDGEPPEVIQIADLFSKGFYLSGFQYFNTMLKLMEEAGFIHLQTSDLTPGVLLNSRTFQKEVKIVFKFPYLMRLLIRMKIISIQFFRHTVAGLTGYFLMSNGYTGYYKIECTK